MNKLVSALAALMLVGCVSDHQFVQVPERSFTVTEPLDILVVMDTSCSMDNDKEVIMFGLSWMAQEFNDLEMDWQMAMISADPTGQDFVEIEPGPDAAWDVATGLGTLEASRLQGEAGFSAALVAYDKYPDWFTAEKTLIVFVSDETEQSLGITSGQEFLDLWPRKPIVASIVGPPPGSNPVWYPACDADQAPKFHEAATLWVSVCETQAWSIVEPLLGEQ